MVMENCVCGVQETLDSVPKSGEFRVAQRKVTMKQLKQALEKGGLREVFGSGTAGQICPVHQILYKGKVRRSCRGWWAERGRAPSILMAPFPQQLHIPTMENWPELILSFQNKLKAIQDIGIQALFLKSLTALSLLVFPSA
ncbi:Branched-chain-amino-acid aminotransferase, mitochondrial [Lemmus lemmus]